MALTFSIETEREDDGRWIAEVMEIPGALAYGATTAEAVARVQALALRVLAERIEHGEIGPELVVRSLFKEKQVGTESFVRQDAAIAVEPPLFDGTRVPLRELHSYMGRDWNLYGFLREFPAVSVEQALAEMERQARETAREIIRVDKDTAGGAPVFYRTDAPVKCMFDYLADARSLKDFHWDYPSVSRIVTGEAIVAGGRILELDAYRGIKNGVVHSDRGIVSGSPVFVGSRMPIRILFDYLADGKTIKDFYYAYDTDIKEHLAPVLKLAVGALEREFYAVTLRTFPLAL